MDEAEETVTSNTLTAAANATAPQSPILFLLRNTCVSVALALLSLQQGAECPARKVALHEKSCMLTERVKRESLPWWRMKLGTLHAETAVSSQPKYIALHLVVSCPCVKMTVLSQ